MATEFCVDCGKQPIYIKKRKLCFFCYGRFYRKAGRILTPANPPQTPHVQRTLVHKGEITFIKSYFDHQNWIYQPAIFYLNGGKYAPDFFDGERGTFIEVSATRQAYHANKKKYALFRQLFPALTLEIRKPDGSLINESGRIDWS